MIDGRPNGDEQAAADYRAGETNEAKVEVADRTKELMAKIEAAFLHNGERPMYYRYVGHIGTEPTDVESARDGRLQSFLYEQAGDEMGVDRLVQLSGNILEMQEVKPDMMDPRPQATFQVEKPGKNKLGELLFLPDGSALHKLRQFITDKEYGPGYDSRIGLITAQECIEQSMKNDTQQLKEAELRLQRTKDALEQLAKQSPR